MRVCVCRCMFVGLSRRCEQGRVSVGVCVGLPVEVCVVLCV